MKLQLINEAKRFQQLAGINEIEANSNNANPSTTQTPTDVKNLAKAQTTATTVQNKAKAINNVQEFPGAFENWFKTLGYQPNKINKATIKTQIDKVLTNLGYK